MLHLPCTPMHLAFLLSTAAMLRAETAAEANGSCFSLSLDLCAQASQEDIPVDLIVWDVANDDKFLEHWAVLVGKAKVIDLSRAQIDGKDGLVFSLDDYPQNFHSPRVYPSRLLVSQYVKNRRGENYRLASAFLWKSRAVLFGYDVLSAIRSRKGLPLFRAVHSFTKFCVVYPLQWLLVKLEARKEKLLSRIGKK